VCCVCACVRIYLHTRKYKIYTYMNLIFLCNEIQEDNCGGSVGENGFENLKHKVSDIESAISDNQYNLEVCVCV